MVAGGLTAIGVAQLARTGIKSVASIKKSWINKITTAAGPSSYGPSPAKPKHQISGKKIISGGIDVLLATMLFSPALTPEVISSSYFQFAGIDLSYPVALLSGAILMMRAKTTRSQPGEEASGSSRWSKLGYADLIIPAVLFGSHLYGFDIPSKYQLVAGSVSAFSILAKVISQKD